ncbi:MAG: sulfatase-like hydrolase/transferase [Candidatus Polarisedimenticolaceae bacterium]|nr:sulfatase-like hydrolase/transferase [Candidatus Polarisedimenticolaceae bacterium]
MDWLYSRRIRYIGRIVLLYFTLFALLRGLFYFGFSGIENDQGATADDILWALYIGLKFDLRLALLATLPVALLAFLPYFNLVTCAVVRRVNSLYITVSAALLLLVYSIDLGHYSYLGVRLNSTVMRFLEDLQISADMMWQSYPVLWILLAEIITVMVFVYVADLLGRKLLAEAPALIVRRDSVLGMTALSIFFIGGILAKMPGNLHSPMPLRWNDAFFSNSIPVTSLGLNPVLYFADSFKNKEDLYDRKKVRANYAEISDYLSVDRPDSETLTFERHLPASNHAVGVGGQRPNIILVMLESLGASRVSAYGNPIKTTPNLDMMAENGWFFENFYVPVSGTARTVFATFTGMPDVSSVRTASRNPLITEQIMLINEFKEYSKYYVIGGNLGWANMSALITHNIPDMQIYQEGMYDAPVVDVWGISDLELFKAADKIFAKQPKDKPFIAFVQTAANHRPFTIPDETGGFQVDETTPEAELDRAGFRSRAQYNAVRLLDFNVGKFLEMAKRHDYFDNTIFVFYGDHNNRVTTIPHMKPFHLPLDLDGLHVPHIYYAPKLLKPRVIDEAVSLVDVMPSMAGFVGIPYRNTTMGRDINNPAPEGERIVFTKDSGKMNPMIGAVSKNFMYRIRYGADYEALHDLNSDSPTEDVTAEHPERAAYMRKMALGIYDTTKYMFHHNNEKRQAELH